MPDMNENRETQQEYFGVHTDNKETLQNALKRIAALERKLEQTEKDLTDYQFNYPKIKDLEKENATLKKRLDALSGDVPWSKLKDVSEVTEELAEAKEILQTVLDKWKEERWILQSDEEIKQTENLMEQAENFLKE